MTPAQAGPGARRRRHRAVPGSNNGEADALELLGADVPSVLSGHNSYGDSGPPSDDVTAPGTSIDDGGGPSPAGVARRIASARWTARAS